LNIPWCGLNPGDIAPLGVNESLQNRLKRLNLGWSGPINENDVESITTFLGVDVNRLGKSDIESLTRFNLEELDVSWCSLRPGDMTPLYGSKSLQSSLRKLRSKGNALSKNDMESLTRFMFEELDVSHCWLNRGDVTPLGRSESLRSCLRRLDLSVNQLGRSDIELFIGFSLERLDVSWCGLKSEDITPLNESKLLQSFPRKLSLIWNGFPSHDLESQYNACNFDELVFLL
jgi:hypothetical protein